MSAPRPGPISTTVSSPVQLQRVGDAAEDAPVGEKVLAEALAGRREVARDATAARLRRAACRSALEDDEREVVAARRVAGVCVEQRRRRGRAICAGGSSRCCATQSSTGSSPRRSPSRLRASLMPSVNSTSRSPPTSHGRARSRGASSAMPSGGSAGRRDARPSPSRVTTNACGWPVLRVAQLAAARDRRRRRTRR